MIGSRPPSEWLPGGAGRSIFDFNLLGVGVRRFVSALGVAVLSAVLVLSCVPANAVDPLPPPVAEFPDIPGRVMRAITGSPLANQTFLMQQAMLEFGKRNPVSPPVSVPPATPRPITAPAALARVAGTGLTAVMAGWAISANGTIGIVAMGTGQDFANVYCSQPGWYQGVTAFVSLSIAPDCKSLVEGPNSDKPLGVSMTIGTWATRQFVGAGPAFSLNSAVCGPPGYNASTAGDTIVVYWNNSTGGISQGSASYTTNSSILNANCGTTAAGMFGTLSGPSGTVYPTVERMARTRSGVVQETVFPTRPNPTRTPDCKIVAEDGSFRVGQGTPYNENDGIPLTAAGLGCDQIYEDFVSEPGRGPGFVPHRIEVGSTDDQGIRTIISDQETPDFSESELESMVPNGNAQGLRLEKVIGSVVGNCMTWAVDCAEWWTQTNSGTQPTTGTTTYKCTYAGREIALAECGVYRNTFDAQTQTPTITDPETGTQVPWYQGAPQPNPSTGTGTFPGSGTSPGAAVTPGPTGGGGCAAAWSWNPVDWVLNPLKCAFIPSTSSVTALTTHLETRWQTTGIGALGTAVAGWSFVAPSSGGCGGILVPLSVLGDGIEDFHILNACAGEPLAPLATLSTLVIGIGAVLTAIRAVTGSVGGIVGQRALAGGDA